MRGRPASPFEIKRARDMKAAGHSLAEIGRELGRARETVRIWINPDAAEKNRHRSRTYSKAVKPTVRGVSCDRCGGPVRCRRATICGACRAADGERKNELIAAMYRTGKTRAEIAKALGLSEGAVAQRAHRLRRDQMAPVPRASRRTRRFITNGHKPPRRELPAPTEHNPEELQRLIEEQAKEEQRSHYAWGEGGKWTVSLDAPVGDESGASLQDFLVAEHSGEIEELMAA